jgi:SAM-dependent methyltransferase
MTVRCIWMDGLEDLQSNWDAFGRDDPMWAVLTQFGLSENNWDAETFFATGHDEVRGLRTGAEQIGLALRLGRALDFGCGVGRITQALAAVCDEAVGVDIAPSMIDAARRLNRFDQRCSYVVNATDDLSIFADESFDVIVSKIVLQHIPPVHTRRYLAEFARVLAPGGVLLFQLPSHHVGRTPLTDWSSRASARGLPSTVKAGGSVTIDVSAVNTGAVAWPPGNHAAIAVGAQWRHVDGGVVANGPEGRLWTTMEVPPGQALTGSITLDAPRAPGRFRLQVGLLQESIAWAHEHGVAPWTGGVRVRGIPAHSALRWVARRSGPIGRVLRRRGVILPTAAVDQSAPIMQMHGVGRDEVEAVLVDAGATVSFVQTDDAAPGWVSYTYWVTR